MRRPRPYIPLGMRVKVAERQCFAAFETAEAMYRMHIQQRSMKGRLHWLLTIMFSFIGSDGSLLPHKAQLDHDPALENRKFNARTGKYTPDANDPRYLIYREKAEHLQKTTGRRPGASRTVTSKGSDNWLAQKFRKLEGKPKRKAKIPSRPFPKRRAKNAAR